MRRDFASHLLDLSGLMMLASIASAVSGGEKAIHNDTTRLDAAGSCIPCHDGGTTFSQVWLETALIEPRGCQGSLLFHSLNPMTGKDNIVSSNPANATIRLDGTLKLSEDDGRTWTESLRYARKPAPNFTGYSDIAVMPDGSVGVLCERGDLEDASKKSERYDKVAFVVVPFTEIRTPLTIRLPTPQAPILTGHLGLGETNAPGGRTLWADNRCLDRPHILPGLIEDAPTYRAIVELAEPIKRAAATNRSTKLTRHGRRLEVTVNDIHEIVMISY
jgi:hypothetical protein